ncbi:ImmA/IrrE family metallo-endopeptidase [Klebsiella pneumoniae]|uniref:ImmA/IrrE family metallo-endopeptidase n=1 Tax=Klebsiella pneumoniae TaxID=573 RepID=UPI0020CE7EBF|nr:ImmA/IrrE family metallo-endopeptidase [Klebsiella pneumoniae]MCQ0469309.1 ImmA/IrrE family metallo-endopeptidase [Klebsiella pneumoniae]MCX2983516.1 ImmA/IrrE family metallo-endopeptidase [Klebsiella pneumoniae]HBW8615418.1 ImmA/IrrE family metallo-endopeptidase [Klebsiella pneumoniae]HCQ9143823.1 ImmA/IrrE family metallo-endopeptidase [Klebsiella pneumoniae]HCQ9173640.1 ImmA/IrrE family metallo-endopeptidase [Klebsiella pneumoniae]
MATVELQLSPQMIDWVADQGGYTPSALAEELMPKKKEMFLRGHVTKTVAEKLARIGQIPFGYLFLDTPPKNTPPTIPDLRQTINPIPLSKDFIDTYNDIKYKIDWYKEYLDDFGIQFNIDFIGRFSINDDFRLVAQDISQTIELDIKKILNKITKDSYFSFACNLIEKKGILVFKNGIVKSNTKRTIDPNEFRGFCLIDEMVPCVFVNGTDSYSAQVFTLFHEVAHIWVGNAGVSNWQFDNKIESFCNKVAAEVLMPHDLFKKKWDQETEFTDELLVAAINVASFFKVSLYATAIKAKSLNLINDIDFVTLRNYVLNVPKKESSGANPYATYPYRNSPKLTDAILSSTMNQQLPLREAANLLNIKTGTVIELYKQRTSKK